MTQKNTGINQITEGVIWRQLLIFFFPIVFGTFFQQLYNTVDTIVVGHFVSTEALASVGGSAAQIINLIVGFFTGLCSGASVVIAQFYGAKNEHSVRQGLHTAYALSIIGSILITIPGVIFAPTFLSWMNTPQELIAESALYLRVYFCGIIFVFIFNMGSSVLRAIGDSRRPLYYLITCCIVNIVLDIVLVVVFRMGVLGVALATLIAQAVSAFLVTYKLMTTKGILHLSLSQIHPSGPMIKRQLRIGLPEGFQTVMYNITNVIIQAAMNGFGTKTAAAWSAFGKLDAMFWMVSTAFGISITTFVGQNFGASKFDRVRKSTRVCLGMDALVSFIMVMILITGRTFLFSLFTNDTTVVQIGSEMLLQITPWYIVFIFIEVLSGSLRGMGDVVIPLILTMCGACFLRIAWVLGSLRFSPTTSTIIMGYPVTWVTTAILFIIYYFYRIRKVQKNFL